MDSGGRMQAMILKLQPVSRRRGRNDGFLVGSFPACFSRIRDGSSSGGLFAYTSNELTNQVVNASRADEAVQIGRPAVKAVEDE
jgi:hypothetical protein